MHSPAFSELSISDEGADFASNANASEAGDREEDHASETGVSASGDVHGAVDEPSNLSAGNDDDDADDQVYCDPAPSSSGSSEGTPTYGKEEFDRLWRDFDNMIDRLETCRVAKHALEKKVDTLEKQATEAQEKITTLKAACKEQLVDFENRIAYLKFRSISEVESHQQTEKESEEKNRDLKKQLEDSHEEFRVLLHKYQLRKSTLSSTTAKNEYLEKKIHALEGQMANEEQRADEAKVAQKQKSSKKASRKAQEQAQILVDEKCQELSKEKAKVADLEEQIKLLNEDAKLKELSDKITSVRNNYLEGMNLGLQAKIQNMPMLEAEISELKKQLTDQTTTIPYLLSRVTDLEKQLTERRSTVHYLNTKVLQLLEQNREHECFALSLELNEQIKVAREEVNKHESTIADLKSKYAVVCQRLEVVSAENGALRSRNSILEQQNVWNSEAERKAAYQIMDLENALDGLQGVAEESTESDRLISEDGGAGSAFQA